MVELNKSFEEGISDLDCNEQMSKFLIKILNYELNLNENKNKTQSDVLEQYRKWVEYSSEGD